MEDMDESDYERLRKMGGLALREYDYDPPWYEAAWNRVVSWVDWGLVIVQWVACGIVGIVTGVLSVGLDILEGIGSLLVGAYDLLGALVYGISGRAGDARGEPGGAGRDAERAATVAHPHRHARSHRAAPGPRRGLRQLRADSRTRGRRAVHRW